jgi:N-acetyl sugar amidotransferase
MSIKKRDVLELYKLPKDVKFCKNCTVSNQRPRITFDENDICSACNFANYKRSQVDWKKREEELLVFLDKYRKNDGSYDVIVPVSGGKDGGFVAHMLKYKYNMTPLTVTWSPALYTEIGRQNLDNFIHIGGFDNILGSVNGSVHRKMSKRSFIVMGDNFLPFVYGQTNFPLKIAIQNEVNLIMYGENGEVEYGGDMSLAESPEKDMTHYDNIFFSNKSPIDWEGDGITKQEIYPYMGPTLNTIKEKEIVIQFFGHYHFWDPQENFYYCSKHNGFQVNPNRSEGTYSKYASLDDQTDWLHYYLSYIKFGIGRATSDTAHEIRDNKIDREEGKALVKKYDGELTEKYFKITLDYLDITEGEFWDVIDSWRSAHLWKKENGIWELRHAVWH